MADAIEMSATRTIACIFLLLSIGASLATSYIMVHNPNCMGAQTIRMPEQQGAGPPPGGAVIATTAVVEPPKPPPPPPPLPPSLVPSCSANQMTRITEQLPSEGCSQAPWAQACSFSIATVKSGCSDSTSYFRQPLASMSLQDPFVAVLVGIQDKDDTIMDLLQLVTHDKNRYDVDKWRQVAEITTCPKLPVSFAGTPQRAKILVLEPDINKAMEAKRWKTETGLTDSDLRGETTQITSKPASETSSTLTKWAASNVPIGPIHFLKISGGNDYDVLVSGAGGALNRVWYLEFQYDWKGAWASQFLKTLIDDTLRDFSCYWKGTDGNLWRITGCWQPHYAKHNWALITCVNVAIDAAKPIYEKMEQVFDYTLKKDLVFGGR